LQGDYASIGTHNGTTVALAATPPCEHEAFPWVGSVSQNGLFEPFIHKNEHFDKTGSGQT
jgi:hypothetical protein